MVDRTIGFFSETGDERGLAANEEEIRQKMNEHYMQILLNEHRINLSKKRFLRGLILQRIREVMEQGDGTFCTVQLIRLAGSQGDVLNYCVPLLCTHWGDGRRHRPQQVDNFKVHS